MSEAFHLRIEGFCPICERQTAYTADGPYLRNTLTCTTCPGGSVPRERAVALVLNETRPNWRALAIHECSPAPRGISVKLKEQCANYVATNYFPNASAGSVVLGQRNENLERQTFADESFDLVITIDVFEHLLDPAAAMREIHRTLKPGGACISAFPIIKHQGQAVRWRVRRDDNGVIEYLEEEQYHGNPIDPKGSLVSVDYGYDVHQLFALWAPFDVRVLRFADRRAGVLGELTDVLACEKSTQQFGRPKSDGLLAAVEKLPMPAPAQAFKIGGDHTKFRSVGVALARTLQRFAGLQPHHRVLEIGSGYGRVALPLTQILNVGSYDGVEIMAEAVAWSSEQITPLYPKFKFHHFDLYNEFYNPSGRGTVADTPLPFEDGAFDLVFLTSVFTHLPPEDARAYLGEIRRVLKPDGTVWATWFMVDSGVGEAILDGRAQVPIRCPDGNGTYFANENRGTLAVGYDEPLIDDLYREAGLAIYLKRRGTWCGRTQPSENPGFQDSIAARPA